MTELDRLLRRVLEEPKATLPREVYADYLRDLGGVENEARAELIGLQLRLDALGASEVVDVRKVFTGDWFSMGVRVEADRSHTSANIEVGKRYVFFDGKSSVEGWVKVVSSSDNKAVITVTPELHPQREVIKPLRISEKAILDEYGDLWAGDALLNVGFRANSTWVPEAEWVYHRGFVGEIWLSALAFVGGECNQCERDIFADNPVTSCERCDGKGEVPGVAKDVFAKHPVTVVMLPDRYPQKLHGSDEWSWLPVADISLAVEYCVPDPLYDILNEPKFKSIYSGGVRSWQLGTSTIYPASGVARTALHAAATWYGRRLNGLPDVRV